MTTIDIIKNEITNYYNITKDELIGISRKPNLVYYRNVAIYLSRVITKETYSKIGLEFGGRDPKTIKKSYDKIKNLHSDITLNNDIKCLRNLIDNQIIVYNLTKEIYEELNLKIIDIKHELTLEKYKKAIHYTGSYEDFEKAVTNYLTNL